MLVMFELFYACTMLVMISSSWLFGSQFHFVANMPYPTSYAQAIMNFAIILLFTFIIPRKVHRIGPTSEVTATSYFYVKQQ